MDSESANSLEMNSHKNTTNEYVIEFIFEEQNRESARS